VSGEETKETLAAKKEDAKKAAEEEEGVTPK